MIFLLYHELVKIISFSISSMSLDDRLITGRPHGGMSVLWNKSLSNSIRTIQYDDNRIHP